jgi:hypothetical protein
MKSILVVAAACMLGQTPAGSYLPGTAQPANQGKVVQAPNYSAQGNNNSNGQPQAAPVNSCCNCTQAQPCLLERLRARLQHMCNLDAAPGAVCNTPCPTCSAPHTACNTPCPARNTPYAACNTPCQACNTRTAHAATPCPCCVTVVNQPKLEIANVRPRYASKVGHEDDFSWITGQLYYLHVDGGIWVVRYASVDTEDKFGGSVVLTAGVPMHNFREGDLVSVRGEILNNGRPAGHVGGALYRPEHIDMVERAD